MSKKQLQETEEESKMSVNEMLHRHQWRLVSAGARNKQMGIQGEHPGDIGHRADMSSQELGMRTHRKTV